MLDANPLPALLLNWKLLVPLIPIWLTASGNFISFFLFFFFLSSLFSDSLFLIPSSGIISDLLHFFFLVNPVTAGA